MTFHFTFNSNVQCSEIWLNTIAIFFSKWYETDFICDLSLATAKVRPEKKHSTQESFIINVSCLKMCVILITTWNFH